MNLTSTEANRGEVQLRGLLLRLLQALWLVLVLIDLATLIVSLPGYYQTLFTLCPGPVTSCPDTGQLSAQTLPTLQHAGFSLNTYAFYVIFLDALPTLSFLLIGALIIWRRANTWMGLFVSFLLIEFGSLGLSFAHMDGFPNVSFNLLLNILNIALFIPTILYYPCLSFFFSTFPDGRFVPRWSWALIGLWAVNTFFWVIGGFIPNSPLEIGNWPPLLEAFWLSVVFGGSACTQLYRYLRVASPIQRQQIKWLLYGFGAGVAAVPYTLYDVRALSQSARSLFDQYAQLVFPDCYTASVPLLVSARPVLRWHRAAALSPVGHRPHHQPHAGLWYLNGQRDWPLCAGGQLF